MIDPRWVGLGLGLANCLFSSPLEPPVCSCPTSSCCATLPLGDVTGAFDGITTRSIWLYNQTIVVNACASPGLSVGLSPAGDDPAPPGGMVSGVYAATCSASSGTWGALDTRVAGDGQYVITLSGRLYGNVSVCVADGALPWAVGTRNTTVRDSTLKSAVRVLVKDGTSLPAVASLAAGGYIVAAASSGNFSVAMSASAGFDVLKASIKSSIPDAVVLRRSGSEREAGVFVAGVRPDRVELVGIPDAMWNETQKVFMVTLVSKPGGAVGATYSALVNMVLQLERQGLLVWLDTEASLEESTSVFEKRAALTWWIPLLSVSLGIVSTTTAITMALRSCRASNQNSPKDAKPPQKPPVASEKPAAVGYGAAMPLATQVSIPKEQLGPPVPSAVSGYRKRLW